MKIFHTSALSNWMGKFFVMAALVMPIALAGAPLPLSAQEQQPPQQPQQSPQQQPLTQQEIEQLVAPIALYPDALLAQVLTASTYPLEVAMAARWSEKNPGLKGPALEDAMQNQPWDPSVKGLASVPQVLAMMDDKLDWTQQLGEAFLAQPDEVQNAIQALRAKAEAAGNLKSSKEQRVRRVAATPGPDYVGPPEYIVIEPIEPDYIYVPVYDPVVVFGIGFWPAAYVPFFWYPPWWTVGPVFGFGPAFFVGPAIWCQYNWGYAGFASIQVNTVYYSQFNKVAYTGGGAGRLQTWKFEPAHHGNVPFKNPKLQHQFGNLGATGIQRGQTERTYQRGQTGKTFQGGQSGKTFRGGKTFQGGQSSKTFQDGQSGKTFQGGQSSKTFQGGQSRKTFQSGQSRKTFQGSQSRKTFQSGQSRKTFQGSQSRKTFQSGQSGKTFQGGQSGKTFQRGQSGRSIQGGQKGQGYSR